MTGNLRDPHGGVSSPPVRSPAASRVRLIVGTEEIAYELVSGPYVMGRFAKGVDIAIPETTVSRVHCAIVVSASEVFVRDLGSRWGTLVNGARVETSPLFDGDELRLGQIRVAVRISSRPAGVIPAASFHEIIAGGDPQRAVPRAVPDSGSTASRSTNAGLEDTRTVSPSPAPRPGVPAERGQPTPEGPVRIQYVAYNPPTPAPLSLERAGEGMLDPRYIAREILSDARQLRHRQETVVPLTDLVDEVLAECAAQRFAEVSEPPPTEEAIPVVEQSLFRGLSFERMLLVVGIIVVTVVLVTLVTLFVAKLYSE